MKTVLSLFFVAAILAANAFVIDSQEQENRASSKSDWVERHVDNDESMYQGEISPSESADTDPKFVLFNKKTVK